MSIFVECLKRLYEDKQVQKERLDALLVSRTISKAEYDYIIGRDGG